MTIDQTIDFLLREVLDYQTNLDSDALVRSRYKPVRTKQPIFDVPEYMVVRGRSHATVRRRCQPVVRGRTHRVRRHRAFVLLYENKTLAKK